MLFLCHWDMFSGELRTFNLLDASSDILRINISICITHLHQSHLPKRLATQKTYWRVSFLLLAYAKMSSLFIVNTHIPPTERTDGWMIQAENTAFLWHSHFFCLLYHQLWGGQEAQEPVSTFTSAVHSTLVTPVWWWTDFYGLILHTPLLSPHSYPLTLMSFAFAWLES